MPELKTKKEEIQSIGLDKIQEYFNLTRDELEKVNPGALKHLHNMARLGMQFEREMNLGDRTNTKNHISIGKLVTETREELKQYIKKTLPQYFT